MSLFGKKEKEEIQRLKAQLSPEQIELADLGYRLEGARAELNNVMASLARARAELNTTRQEIIETEEAVLLQSFGIYTPHECF